MSHKHINMIISEPAIEIKCNVNIAVCWLKSQTTSHGDFIQYYVCVLGLLIANAAAIKIVIK